MQKAGFSRKGKQRYRCPVCKIRFEWDSPNAKQLSDIELLRLYVHKGWTLAQLGEYLGNSAKWVQKRIHRTLIKPIPIVIVDIPTSGILILDATWNHRQWCLLLYRDSKGQILTHRFDLAERYEGYLEDLSRLKIAGYQPQAIVSDGHLSLLKAIAAVYPQVPQQRCLLHIQRQCLLWLTQHPKTLAAGSLRYIVLQLLKVDSSHEAHVWNVLFDTWSELFTDVLNERTYSTSSTPIDKHKRSWWYTHKSLRKAWRLLKNSQSQLWLWLTQPEVPKTTNLLEGGINAPIKRLLHRHSGLRLDRQKLAIAWWVFFRNNP